ncbi:MAG: 4Fe-4S binding protein [Myxococcaceae bacterium]
MSSGEPARPLSAPPPPPAAAPKPAKPVRDWPGIDLLERYPVARKILKWRGLQFWLIWVNVVFFAAFLYAGLFGSPVGSRNVMIVFVWIFWWFLLIAILVPFFSRLWCTMCPLPVFGEWMQRLRLVGVRAGEGPKGQKTRMFGLNLEWPKPLRNIWLQNVGFLCLASFSALLVTRPIISTFVLGGMIVIAVALSLVFRQRAFCMYLCPVSGFLGLYSMTSTTAVRVKDPALCRSHKAKECLVGCQDGYGCPWYQYVGSMTRNNYCGMCFECIKTCPHDNVTVYLRPLCSDRTLKGYDEAFKAFIMMVLALVYSVTLLGPWGTVKDWANVTEVGDWKGFGLYVLAVVGSCLVVFPALHLSATWLGRLLASEPAAKLKDNFVRYAYVWVPLGLFAWIAFSVPLIAVNGAYILSTASDPMGNGWDLFRTAQVHWHPLLPEWIGLVQLPLLLVGLYFSFSSTWEIGRELYPDAKKALRSLAPTWVLASTMTALLMAFFVG